jgi:hypothetical protein
MPVSEPSSVNWPERCQIGAFDTGEFAGIYPLTSRSIRPDMTMREYVRADEVERLRQALQAIYAGTGEAKHNPREFARATLNAS